MPLAPEHIALVADALLAVLRLRLPPEPLPLGAPQIDASFDNQACGSAPALAASALSIAAVADGRSYRDSGQRYEVRLDAPSGAATFRAIGTDGMASAWAPLAHAVTYHQARAGVAMSAPPFDMVAAGAGRVFAKVRGRSQFFFNFLDPMFRTSDGTPVPSSYFKLDPQIGQAYAKSSDLLAHLPAQAGEARVHPAAIRFAAFRALLATGLADLMVVNQDRRPRTWHELDFRPPESGVDPPTAGDAPPRTRLVSYRRPDGSVLHKLGYRMHRVLGIGVGHEHWHEQTSPVYGGEMDSLGGPGLPPVLMEHDVYRFFNGPVNDQGGFIDGTGNYYVLAQLVDDAGLAGGPRPDGYAVLWADEQAVFSERWRLVHPSDSEFGAFRDVVPSALVQYLARTPRYHSLAFDARKFWCPCRAMHVGPHSRMAVQRQVVVVSGYDPKQLAHRFYSIHWSFGTADRTWRWRSLPPLPNLQPMPPARVADARPPYESFGLREDMTLHLVHEFAGLRRVWFQRYLPADHAQSPDDRSLRLPASQCLERPSTAQQTAELIQMMVKRSEPQSVPNGPMPGVGYAHPWHSLPEDTWLELHRRFSHMGCLSPVVDARCQYYRLDEATAAGVPLGVPLEEASGALAIRTPTLNWDALNEVLADTNFTAAIEAARQRIEQLKKDHRALIELVGRLQAGLGQAHAEVLQTEQALKALVRLALRTMDSGREGLRDSILDITVERVLVPIKGAFPYTALSEGDRKAVRAGARSFVNAGLDVLAFTALWSRVEQVATATDAQVDAIVADLRALPPGLRTANRVRQMLVGRLKAALDDTLGNGASLVPAFTVSVTLPVVGRVSHRFEAPAVSLAIAPLRRAVSDGVDAMSAFGVKCAAVATRLEALFEHLATQIRLGAELLAARARLEAEHSAESAFQELVALLERLKRSAPLVRAERRSPLFSPCFTLMALHRPPLGTILVHWDKRDDDLQPFAPFGAPGAGPLPLELRPRNTAASPIRARISSWHACAAPPCVPEATVGVESVPGDPRSKRLVVAFRSPYTGTRLDENVWRVCLAALPRDASGRFGAAPEVLCQLLRHEAFKPIPGKPGWQHGSIELPTGSTLHAQVETFCSAAGRDRYGTALWFENVVGQPAPPDRLTFGS